MVTSPRRFLPSIRSVVLTLATLIAAVAAAPSAYAATWAPHSLVFPPGISQVSLFGVSCSSTTTCTAAGNDFNGVGGAHAESGVGATWVPEGVLRNPGPKNGILRAVSCVTATYCVTVGSYGTSTGGAASMAQSRSGSSWTFWNTGNPAGASAAALLGVSCRSTTWCMMVGYKTVSGLGRPWALKFTGTSWTDAGAGSVSNSTLNSVSCTSTSYCVAVGYAGSGPTAQVWNGTTWTTSTPPVPGAYSSANLASVSCVSATWCLATGTYTNSSGDDRPYADIWNGTSWATTAAIPWGGNIEAQAYGVSCVSTTECWIVGEGHYGSAITPWGVLWTGTTWAIGSLPMASGAGGATLRSVSCTATGRCEAAGWSLFSGTPTGLIETLS